MVLAMMFVTIVQHEEQQAKPGFSYYAPEDKDAAEITLIFIAVVMIILYYIAYVTSIFLGCKAILMSDKVAKVVFDCN